MLKETNLEKASISFSERLIEGLQQIERWIGQDTHKRKVFLESLAQAEQLIRLTTYLEDPEVGKRFILLDSGDHFHDFIQSLMTSSPILTGDQ